MNSVYILRSISRPAQLYVGVSSNLAQRLEYHNTGRSPHTAKVTPWEIVYSEDFEDEAAAFGRERQLKGWSWAKKEALTRGNLG